MNRVPRQSRRVLAGARLTLLTTGLLLLSACSDDAPQDALKPAGEWARKLDGLFDVGFAIAAVVFFLVEGILVYALVRFRNRPDNESPRQVHGSTPLEIGWTILPALILAVLAVPTVATIFELSEKPAGALEVTVTGHQWWWEYDYENAEAKGVEAANELHIPAGRQVRVTLRSFDVIHSFWVPQLAGKLDVVPGHENHLVMHADEPGLYLGQCAEFCGLSHANMRLRVIAHTPEDFADWVAGQREPAAVPASGPAAGGYALFETKGCGGCHTLEGHEASGGADVGPNLTHLQSRSTFAGGIFDLTADNLRTWLRDPPRMKPMDPDNNVGMPDLGLSDEEIEQLVAYLETLE